jgi:hypothetical protein
MTEEQQERATSFALDLLDLISNELVIGDWETFICKGASDILIELVSDNIDKNKEKLDEMELQKAKKELDKTGITYLNDVLIVEEF